MTKRMEKSRRHGGHDPRSQKPALTLVPQLPPTSHEAPHDSGAVVGPVALWLVSQPAPQKPRSMFNCDDSH